MPETVRFYFDPICPWAYQTSRWVRRLSELGEIDLDWGVFSLELVNAERDPERPEGGLTEAESKRKGHGRSGRALRTVIAVREAAGARGVGAFYAALGRRVHEAGEAIDDGDTVKHALDEAGLDTTLGESGPLDDLHWEAVQTEHRALVEQTRSFGVPTIVLGSGQAIFGPVISELPADDEAVELWRHVAWLTRYDNFSELKRDRVLDPDLESVRAARRAG
jgi:2-hydroxychromene-2-carboxylate isomerase